MAKVEFTREAREDLESLDGSAKKIVAKGIRKLETNPELRGDPLGSKVTGNLTNFRKLVVGNRTYRIVYEVLADDVLCVIWVIGARSDNECYELAVSRTLQAPESERLRLKSLLDSAFER